MRTTLGVLIALAVIGPNASFAATPAEARSFVARLAGKKSMVMVGAGATWSHILNVPREWGRGAGGFGKRVGSTFGKQAVKESVQFGVAGWRHEDLKYYPSEQPGFRPRLRHALLSTVIARRKPTGGRTPALGRITGSLAGGFVSRLWMPARLHTFASGLGSGGLSLAADAGMNVTREFWPEIRHPRAPEKRIR